MLNKKRNIFDFKEFFCQTCKRYKFRLLIVLIASLIAMLTGVILAIKTKSVDYFSLWGKGQNRISQTSFWLRLLSMLVVFFMVVIGSLNVYLMPIGILFIAYRCFLMGGNITLLIILNGISGIVIGLMVIVPCQLISLTIFILAFLFLSEARGYKRKYECERQRHYFIFLMLIGILSIVVLCLLESLLICLFSPKVIFVF